jgi:hypothetical protein
MFSNKSAGKKLPKRLLRRLEGVIPSRPPRVGALREFLFEIGSEAGVEVHLPPEEFADFPILGSTCCETAEDAFCRIANLANLIPVYHNDGVHFIPIPPPSYDIDEYLLRDEHLQSPSGPFNLIDRLSGPLHFYRDSDSCSERPEHAFFEPEYAVRYIREFLVMMGNGFKCFFDSDGFLGFCRVESAFRLLPNSKALPLLSEVRRVVEEAGFRLPVKQAHLWVGDDPQWFDLPADAENKLSKLDSEFWDLDSNREDNPSLEVLRYLARHRELLLTRKPATASQK